MKRYLTAALLVCAFPLAAVGAQAALVQVNGLVLKADGGFTPRKLPQRAFAPIDFQGFAKVTSMSGGVPPPLERVLLDLDRDGRLSTAGLPTCAAAQVETASPGEARARCPGAIVGTGTVKALIAREGQPALPAASALTLFNGPRLGGHPSVVFHAQTTVPALQTFAIPVPIERRSGAYAYRATLELPPIAGGLGSLVYVKLKIGKRFRTAGVERSYVSARCSDNVLETLGRFDFADGTVIYGPVMKPCTTL